MADELVKGPIGAFPVASQLSGTLPRSAGKRVDASIVSSLIPVYLRMIEHSSQQDL